VTLAQANADVGRMIPIWMNAWPTIPGADPRVYESWRIAPALRPLKQDVVGNIGSALWVLMGTIGIVMLMVCANVANLLLVRAEARQQELAVRAALGAGWTRIIRELLVESLLLGMTGGALGLALAHAGLQMLIANGPANLPRLHEISIDARALAFTVALSLISSVLFGLIPAFRYARPGVSASLRGGGRTSSQSLERHRMRDMLVVARVALALVLLVSAGLMLRTSQALRAVEPGFVRPGQLQTLHFHSLVARARSAEGRPIAERPAEQVRGDTGCDGSRVRQRDAHGGQCSRLGRDRHRGHDDSSRRKSAAPAAQICLARVLSNLGHQARGRARRHLDRSVRPATPGHRFGKSRP
jgi:hypothetical protein